MSQVIRVSDDLYKKLESLAKGFDTPNNVIQQLYDFFEVAGKSEESKEVKQLKQAAKLSSVPRDVEIIFSPPSEEAFKRELIRSPHATVRLHKTDGAVVVKNWNAKNITESSSINRNLRSGFLRNWKEKGIYKAEISLSAN